MATQPAQAEAPAPAVTGLTGDMAARWAWIMEMLKIHDRDGTVCALLPNCGQRIILAAMHMQESQGIPVRIILLKARQFGGSTFVQADFFGRCRELAHRQAFTVAHKAEATSRLFEMSKRFWKYLPEGQRPALDAHNGYKLAFSEPIGSMMSTSTAGSPDAARSGTYQLAHCSEYAFWDDQVATMAAIDSAVPYTPGTVIIIESTANGIGDDFNARSVKAVKRFRSGDITGYIPVFVGWLQIEEYALAVPAGYN